mgnify:FL=1
MSDQYRPRWKDFEVPSHDPTSKINLREFHQKDIGMSKEIMEECWKQACGIIQSEGSFYRELAQARALLAVALYQERMKQELRSDKKD